MELDLPKDTYNVLTFTLKSERICVVVLPSDIDTEEAKEIAENLGELRDVVAGWKAN